MTGTHELGHRLFKGRHARTEGKMGCPEYRNDCIDILLGYIQTGIVSPVAGLIASTPENTPVFSGSSRVLVVVRAAITLSLYLSISLSPIKPSSTHFFPSSAEMAKKVTPNKVSGRVVNTLILDS
jgi:hypothetical protein